jgi:hypothetical protein
VGGGPEADVTGAVEARAAQIGARHLSVGWWALLVTLLSGVVLEALHGFKVGAYLDVGHETRRLMWTLAHAHGALLSLVNVAFGLTAKAAPRAAGGSLASPCLLAALVLLPVGFFAGGFGVQGGDPGLGVLLVPIGAVPLAVGVASIARRLAMDRA